MSRARSAVAALEARPAIVVGAVFVFAAALAAYYTTKITQFQPDEIGYTKLTIEMGDLLQPISTTELGRSRLNQLYPLTIAPFYKAFGNQTAYSLAHIWNAVLMASTALPAYLLAREVLRHRAWAYLFAFLVVIVPWLTLSTVQFTEVAAFPASVWALWGMQRALTAPSTGRDLVAFGLIGLAAFGRLQLIVLAPVFVFAVFVHELRFGADARDLWRRHRVAVLAAGAGVVVGLPLLLTGLLEDLFGFYGNTLTVKQFPPGIWDMARTYFVFMSLGVGAIPGALAIGFALESLARPRDRRTHAFALLMFLSVAVLTLQVAGVTVNFIGGLVQERYLMFVAPSLLLGGMALILEARRPALMAIVGAVPLVALIATTDYQAVPDVFGYLVSPSVTTFYDTIVPRLTSLVGSFADDRVVLPGLMTGLAAGAIAFALRYARREVVLAATCALVAVFLLTMTVHALHRVVYGSPRGAGMGSGSRAEADWVDDALSTGASAVLLAAQVGPAASAREMWWRAEFWNRRIGSGFLLGEPAITFMSTSKLRLLRTSGRIQVPDGTRYVLAVSRGLPTAPRGTEIARSPDGQLSLLRVASPLFARWAVFGAADDGWLPTRSPATLVVYGAPDKCERVSVSVELPAGMPAPRRFMVTGPETRASVLVRPGQQSNVRLRACTGRPRRPVRFRLLSRIGERESIPGASVRLVKVEAVT